MSTFLIAGAGHGGLCAALHLAKAGQEVLVVEQCPEENLGYDWSDTIESYVFERNGFTPPPEEAFLPAFMNTLLGPAKSAPKCPPDAVNRERHMWRRKILRLMIADCKAAGVNFRFETRLLGPIVEKGRVTGVKSEAGDFHADMVIDSAGARSPICGGLPQDSLVPRELKPGQVFYCWRAFLNRLPGDDPENVYKTYLYHMRRKGISWTIANRDYIDVLIGSIVAPLSPREIEETLSDLRKDNPLLGDTVLHGGQQSVIVVRRPLGCMVADGYAAIGDSACMTDPLNGSGLNIAFDAGKMLAEVLLNHCRGDYSAEKLWEYQLKFFTWQPPAVIKEGPGAKTAEGKAETEALKSFMMSLSPNEFDLLFERDILSVEMIFMGEGMSPGKALKMVLRNLDQLPLLGKLFKMGLTVNKIKKITRDIPKTYDAGAISAWLREYEGFAL